MTRALVIGADGAAKRQVKNLGWVLRHWQDVSKLQWIDLDDDMRKHHGLHHMTEGLFIAHLRDGRLFSIPFASFEVWLNFVDRSVFYTLPTTITRCGKTVNTRVVKGMCELWQGVIGLYGTIASM